MLGKNNTVQFTTYVKQNFIKIGPKVSNFSHRNNFNFFKQSSCDLNAGSLRKQSHISIILINFKSQ